MIKVRSIVREVIREAFSRKIVLGVLILGLLAIGLNILFGSQSAQRITDAQAMLRDFPDIGGLTLKQLSMEWYNLNLIALFYPSIIIGVFVTASIIPTMLERGLIELYLSKPISRLTLLGSKLLGGIVLYGGLMSTILIAVWCVVGIYSGVWNPDFLLLIPTTIFCFAAVFCFTSLMALLTRSAAVGIMVVYVMLALSALLYSRESTFYTFITSDFGRSIVDAFYWVFPHIEGMLDNLSLFLNGESTDPFIPIAQICAFLVVNLASCLLVFKRKEF